jgi:pectin methylesterase-like acyl-CoA thioesterase
VFIGDQAAAATLCVNQNPKSGCYTTIGDAVSAAPGDTIQVAAGRYAEDVHVLQPVSLIGAGVKSTIIDAKGLTTFNPITRVRIRSCHSRLASIPARSLKPISPKLKRQIASSSIRSNLIPL